jgi:predicted transcriptional regulator
MTTREMLLVYRLHLNETWPQFAKRFDGIKYPTLFRVLSGANKPNSRTEYRINKYFSSHESEIRAALNKTA